MPFYWFFSLKTYQQAQSRIKWCETNSDQLNTNGTNVKWSLFISAIYVTNLLMDGFQMFSNVESVELLSIKFVNILNWENLNANISYLKIKILNFTINGGSVLTTQALIVQSVKLYVPDSNLTFVCGVEEQNTLFVMLKISNVTLVTWENLFWNQLKFNVKKLTLL